MMKKQIVVRLSAEDYRLLSLVSEKRGEHVSTLVRRLVRSELAKLSYLDDADKKALGVKVAK